MRVEVQFEYDITFIKKGHRNPENVRAGARRVVEILEPQDSEVEVLHECGVPHALNEMSRPALKTFGDRGARIIRHGGRLYAENCLASRLEATFGDHGYATCDGPFHVTPRAESSRFSLMTESSDKDPESARPTREAMERRHGEIRPGTYRDDGGEEWGALIDARAAEMLCWDGSVFVPTSEPVLAVVDAMEGHGEEMASVLAIVVTEARDGGWSAFRTSGRRPWSGDSPLRFRLDDAAGARSAAQALAGNIPVRDLAVVGSVDAGALRFDGTSEAPRWSRTLVNSMANVASASRPAVAIAFAGMRDAARAHGVLASRILHDRTVDFIAAVAREGLPGSPEAGRTASAFMDGRAFECLSHRPESGLAIAAYVTARAASAGEGGLSWLMGAGSLEDPSEADGMLASEILSAFDADRVLDGLGGGAMPDIVPGGVLVGVYRRDPPLNVPVALVSFGPGLDVVGSAGPSGTVAAPRAVALAGIHAERSLAARDALDLDREMSEQDRAAMAF